MNTWTSTRPLGRRLTVILAAATIAAATALPATASRDPLSTVDRIVLQERARLRTPTSSEGLNQAPAGAPRGFDWGAAGAGAGVGIGLSVLLAGAVKAGVGRGRPARA